MADRTNERKRKAPNDTLLHTEQQQSRDKQAQVRVHLDDENLPVSQTASIQHCRKDHLQDQAQGKQEEDTFKGQQSDDNRGQLLSPKQGQLLEKENSHGLQEDENDSQSTLLLQQPTVLSQLKELVDVIQNCDAMIIAAGAGMSLECDLPDYRDPVAWQREYPQLAALGLQYATMASERMMLQYPKQTWGWFVDRMQRYQTATPHSGYRVLLDFATRCPMGYYVYTSNVDGMFVRTGFDSDKIVECHGSLQRAQCSEKPSHGVWKPKNISLKKAESSSTTTENKPHSCEGGTAAVNITKTEEVSKTPTVTAVPKCRAHRCGKSARPNILMFQDNHFCDQRFVAQQKLYQEWLTTVKQKADRVVILEIGAGKSVPTVREHVKSVGMHLLSADIETAVVRINPDKTKVHYPGPRFTVGQSALRTLLAIKKLQSKSEHNTT